MDHLLFGIHLIAVYALIRAINCHFQLTPFSLPHCFVAPKICPNKHVTFYLYTSVNDSVELSVNDSKSMKNADFNRGPIKILLHGYNGGKDGTPNAQIRPAYFRNTKNINVISIDYGPLVESGCYIHAVQNTDLTANCTAQFIEKLVEIRPDVRLSRIHVIGSSLGAHVAGQIASYLTAGRIERITSLDAALPLYLHLLTPPPYFKAINRGDAKFIDALHTNAGFLGLFLPYADVDFYANGGTFQPACRFWDLKCNHELSAVYYAESINSPIDFTAHSCHFPPPLTLGHCLRETGRAALFGEYVDHNIRGNYTFQTGDKPPYALLESK